MGMIETLVPRFRTLQPEMLSRRKFYALSRNDRGALRLARLNILWKKAATGSRYYAALIRERHLPPGFTSLEEFQALVPITPKAAVRADPAAFRLAGRRRGTWMLTGGSTGAPTRVFWALTGHLESLRDQYFARGWWGVHTFDRMAMLWGHSHSFGRGIAGFSRKLMVPVIDRLRNRMRFSAYQLDAPTLQRYYDAMARFGPASLYAYGSAAHLLACANRGRQPLPQPLKVAFLAAEPILEMFRESIYEVLGCPCAGEYGSIECGMIAYEHPLGMYRVFERSVIVETVPAETGYEIIVTQLRHTGFPLFRYEIGDVAPTPLARGPNGWDTLSTIRGRSHDLLRSPAGAVCHGEALTHIIERIPDVLLFSVVQKATYNLVIQIQTKSGADISPNAANWIKSNVQRLLGNDVPVDVTSVKAEERTLAGKHRWIVSEVGE